MICLSRIGQKTCQPCSPTYEDRQNTSCIWIDHTVYDSPAVADELSARNIVAMKADVTDAGTPASRMLYERFGGAPPLTVLLTPDGRTPVRFDGKFSKDDLFKALAAADGKE